MVEILCSFGNELMIIRHLALNPIIFLYGNNVVLTIALIWTHYDACAADEILKTLWQKDKLLIMNKRYLQYYCHNIFNSII